MPFKSKKQEHFMQMMAHNPDKKGIGPSKEVAEKFIKDSHKDKKKK